MKPNPILYKKQIKKRRRDVCINVGFAFTQQTEATYYIFPEKEKANSLNTFSKTDAEFWENTGTAEIGKHKIERKVTMPLININEIIEKHLKSHPNLISIDVEGLDLEILKTLNFEKYKPEIFCTETLKHAENNMEVKNTGLIDFLVQKGYFIYADTYINTIFCKKGCYKSKIT